MYAILSFRVRLSNSGAPTPGLTDLLCLCVHSRNRQPTSSTCGCVTAFYSFSVIGSQALSPGRIPLHFQPLCGVSMTPACPGRSRFASVQRSTSLPPQMNRLCRHITPLCWLHHTLLTLLCHLPPICKAFPEMLVDLVSCAVAVEVLPYMFTKVEVLASRCVTVLRAGPLTFLFLPFQEYRSASDAVSYRY